MLKYIGYSLLFTLSLSINSKAEPAQDNSAFWKEKSEFDSYLYKSKSHAEESLRKLEYLSSLINNDMEKETFVESKILYLEMYSDAKLFIDYFESYFKFGEIGDSQSLHLLNKLSIVLQNVNDKNRKSELIAMLDKVANEDSRFYALIFNLRTNKSKGAFRGLVANCNLVCDFGDYYLSLFEYYSETKQFKELKTLALALLDRMHTKDFLPREPFYRQLCGYLSLIYHIEGDQESANYFHMASIEGLEKESNLYRGLNSLLN